MGQTSSNTAKPVTRKVSASAFDGLWRWVYQVSIMRYWLYLKKIVFLWESPWQVAIKPKVKN